MRIIRTRRSGKDIYSYYTHIGARDRNAAERFVDAVEQTVIDLARHPHMGSPRLWHATPLRSIRAWPVTGFPQFVIYYRCDSANLLRILRVLRGSVPPQDILRTPP